MPEQTVEDVMMAEARFLEEIIARHPDAEGKPVVVANCQAGWQIMMTAAIRPELLARHESDALCRWPAGRQLAHGDDQRPGQRQIRRRLAGAKLRKPESGQHLVVQAVQPVLQGGH
ncbi:hypothetical protein G6F68_017478 [Rhizopus microsporus]|uniref:Uncharacterized protein n=1 Tax=Rhizopus delemar TaxID=936053 RepID=A0A9P6XPZ4_9FUNG|nr:hypothetical protein G6F68_017478 [Rhizopus microsporus]KAG1529897.1 hypothetical protein G6F50_017685 [Rhizopus delemar]